MDSTDIHTQAIQRHKDYERRAATLPPKPERFRLTWPQQERTRERIKDQHSATLARRALLWRFV